MIFLKISGCGIFCNFYHCIGIIQQGAFFPGGGSGLAVVIRFCLQGLTAVLFERIKAAQPDKRRVPGSAEAPGEIAEKRLKVFQIGKDDVPHPQQKPEWERHRCDYCTKNWSNE